MNFYDNRKKKAFKLGGLGGVDFRKALKEGFLSIPRRVGTMFGATATPYPSMGVMMDKFAPRPVKPGTFGVSGGFEAPPLKQTTPGLMLQDRGMANKPVIEPPPEETKTGVGGALLNQITPRQINMEPFPGYPGLMSTEVPDFNIPEEPTLKPRPPREGIWSTAPRADVGYLLSAIGGAMAPEGSTARKLGDVGAAMAQQKVFSSYVADVLAGREPDDKALGVLSPEQRLQAVQIGEDIKERKFQRDVERVKLDKDKFELAQKIEMFNREMEARAAELKTERAVAKHRTEGYVAEAEIRGQYSLEAERLRNERQQQLTYSDAVSEAGLLARKEIDQTMGDMKEAFMHYMSILGYPISEAEADKLIGSQPSGDLDSLLREAGVE